VGNWLAHYPQFKHYVVYEQIEDGGQSAPDALGRPTIEYLRKWLPDAPDFDTYFLGPKPFMVTIKKFLKELGLPSDRIHFEFFGPAEDLEPFPMPSSPVANSLTVTF